MKRYLPAVMIALLCLLPGASYPQVQGFSLRDAIKISPDVRVKLRHYLDDEYKRECPPDKKPLPDVCGMTKPAYQGEGLPDKDAVPLPPAVIASLGFVYPGMDYVQQGFVVYFIRLQRRIILDSVAVHEPDHSSNIQW
jgi:hypothetical protein